MAQMIPTIIIIADMMARIGYRVVNKLQFASKKCFIVKLNFYVPMFSELAAKFFKSFPFFVVVQVIICGVLYLFP